MSLTVGIALFVLGAILASFAGVVAARYGTGQSMVNGRSRCDACGTQLTWVVLAPFVSYAIFRARARCCGVRISAFAPAFELLLGTVFVLGYVLLGLTPVLTCFLASVTVLLILVEYDLMHQILPPPFLAVFVVLSAATGYLTAPSLTAYAWTAIVGSIIAAFFLLLNLLSRGRLMGLADAPLALGLSLLVGRAAIPGVAFAFWIGALIGIGVLLTRPPGSRMGIEVPFAPFLAAGFLLAFFTQWNPFLFNGLM